MVTESREGRLINFGVALKHYVAPFRRARQASCRARPVVAVAIPCRFGPIGPDPTREDAPGRDFLTAVDRYTSEPPNRKEAIEARREFADRQPRLGRHHADGARRAAAGPRAGLEDQRLGPPRGPAAARRSLRPRRRRATHGGGARRGRARRATQPAPSQPPCPDPGRRAGPRGRLVALRTPGPGVRSSSAAAPRRPPSRPPAAWRSAAMVARYASAVDVEDGAGARLFGGSG